MTTITDEAVRVDAEFDTEHASDGQSRYGTYVRQNMECFAECWDGGKETAIPIHFATTAWRVATGPIMVPGYVRYHRRILAVQLDSSYWDSSLLATVDLITSWPQPLRKSRQRMEQTGHSWWRDWPMEFGDAYHEPSDQDLTEAPYLLTTASLRFTVPSRQLPHVPRGWRGWSTPDPVDVAAIAHESVAVSVRELNRIVGPVIQTLEAN